MHRLRLFHINKFHYLNAIYWQGDSNAIGVVVKCQKHTDIMQLWCVIINRGHTIIFSFHHQSLSMQVLINRKWNPDKFHVEYLYSGRIGCPLELYTGISRMWTENFFDVLNIKQFCWIRLNMTNKIRLI